MADLVVFMADPKHLQRQLRIPNNIASENLNDHLFLLILGTIVIVIVWWLNLQLPVYSVPITTEVVSSNPVQAKCTIYTICDRLCQRFATGRRFSPGTPVSSTNKTDLHDIQTLDKSIRTIPIFPIYFIFFKKIP